LTGVKSEHEWRYLGYDCRVIFHSGYRCGYVRLPYGHPWFCKRYDDIDPVAVDLRHTHRSMDDISPIALMVGAMGEGDNWLRRIEAQVEIHGGLTFASAFDQHTGWWIGFDCFHAGDRRSDVFERQWAKEIGRESPFMRDGHYWTHKEVVAEVEKLARQVREANLRNVRRWGGHETCHPDEERMAWQTAVRHNDERVERMERNMEAFYASKGERYEARSE
jgi:hypothetical protein